MTIQEILEAHGFSIWNQRGLKECACGHQFADGYSSEIHHAHQAEVLEKYIRERESAAWYEAKNAIRNIPCWFKDWDHHGFDIWTDENGYAQEAGARIEVMRVLRKNPYADEEPSNGR